jgi:hypothetical protein
MTLVYLSQNSIPCHMSKCHVGSKADVALTWDKPHKMKFGLLKPAITFSPFLGQNTFCATYC